MLKITKSGLKLVGLPYTLEQPFIGVLDVKNVYKDKLGVEVYRYDKTDTDFRYSLAVEVLIN